MFYQALDSENIFSMRILTKREEVIEVNVSDWIKTLILLFLLLILFLCYLITCNTFS